METTETALEQTTTALPRPFGERIKSRKFLLALASALLIVLNEGLDLGIPPDVYGWIVGVVIAYILGEAYTDGKAASK